MKMVSFNSGKKQRKQKKKEKDTHPTAEDGTVPSSEQGPATVSVDMTSVGTAGSQTSPSGSSFGSYDTIAMTTSEDKKPSPTEQTAEDVSAKGYTRTEDGFNSPYFQQHKTDQGDSTGTQTRDSKATSTIPASSSGNESSKFGQWWTEQTLKNTQDVSSTATVEGLAPVPEGGPLSNTNVQPGKANESAPGKTGSASASMPDPKPGGAPKQPSYTQLLDQYVLNDNKASWYKKINEGTAYTPPTPSNQEEAKQLQH